MADFVKAFLKTAKNEGGYSNNPKDPGGETYMGVSRVFWPTWSGWAIIDEAKTSAMFPGNLSFYTQLKELVMSFYKGQFWDRMHLDQISDQRLAEKLFDMIVNPGITTGVRILQRALNATNRKGILWPNIAIDGAMGPTTLEAIAACEKNNRIDGLLAGMRALQGSYYICLMEKDENKEEFFLGWLTRAMK